MSVSFRIATVDDVFELMRLHQVASTDPTRDQMMLYWRRLAHSIEDRGDLWCVGEADGIVVAASLMQDPVEALAKLHRIYVDPSRDDRDALVSELLRFIVDYLDQRGDIDVLYTTTWKQSLHEIDLAGELGFIMNGIFANSVDPESERVNSIASYFFHDSIGARRIPPDALHPAVAPIYELIREQAPQLEPVQTREPYQLPMPSRPLPTLEMIDAPRFVARRFEKLRSRRSLSTSFYPFQHPDLLITGPDQELEIFVRGIPALRFAMLIGERLDAPVELVRLYREVASLLRWQGFAHIEAINDANDVEGLECMRQAGFVPSLYMPSLKRVDSGRRDYVVLGRSFEKSPRHPTSLNPMLSRFWQAYSGL